MNIDHPSELIDYLRSTGRITPTDSVQVRTLAGGVSNRTVLVERRLSDGSSVRWVCKQALPKLRVTDDWFCDPARIEREALGLQWIARLTPAGSVPAFRAMDPVAHLLIMDAVPEPHENWKSILLRGVIDSSLVQQFGSLLGQLHHASTGQTELAGVFEDRTYFEALRLDPYYVTAASRNPEAQAFYQHLIADTRATRAALVHGDYSPKNTLVHSGRLVLLDFEVVHHGDPAFDIGFSTTHFLSKANHLSKHRSAFLGAAAAHWTAYCAAACSGTAGHQVDPVLEARAVRHTLACLLARIDGRSPLEYLSPEERERQRAAVLELLPRAPATMPELIKAFAHLISR